MKDSCEEKKDDKLKLSGKEIVGIAGSIAICLSEKYEREDLKKIKILLSAIVANLSVVEHDKRD